MYVRRTLSRFAVALALLPIAGMNTVAAQTQSSSPPPSSTSEQHEHGPPPAGQDDQQPDMQMAREASGTAWLPDTTPMYAIHWQRGSWRFMAHENVFYGLLLEYFVVKRQDSAARIPEHDFDAFFLKTSQRDFGTGQLGGNAGSQFHGNT